MSIITILLIAVALSMDSFAVSISNGISLRKLNLKNIVAISFSLAFFQAIMPLIGWFAGVGASQYIEDYDHWVAFVLLAVRHTKINGVFLSFTTLLSSDMNLLIS